LQDAVVEAKPVPNMLEFCEKVRTQVPDAEQVFLTARIRAMRLDTYAWLRTYGLAPSDEAVCFVPNAQAKPKIWGQLARDARLVIIDDLSYDHESDQPSIYHDLVEFARRTASVYIGFEQISQIAADARAVDAVAAALVQSLVDER
jgi:hypothetical protein